MTYLFSKDGYNVKGFDSSDFLIEKAKALDRDLFYVDNLVDMKIKGARYDKIFLASIFQYIHPRHYRKVFDNLNDTISDKGKIYIIAVPDFSKRAIWTQNFKWSKLSNLELARIPLIPIYMPREGSFWIKNAAIRKAALKYGFSQVQKVDCVAHISHFVISR